MLVLNFVDDLLNALPDHLSSIPTLPAFSRALKHHLFLLAYPDSSANLVRSNQLNVSHFVIQRQLNYCHSTAQKYHNVQLNAFHLSDYDLSK